jgi:hypothetical protein
MNEEQQIVKLIRLNTGEDIIASCLIDEETGAVLLGSPMKVYLRRLTEAGQTVLVMMPWLPLELIEEDYATINYGDIITMVEPKQSFVRHYQETIIQYQAVLDSRNLEEELSADSDDEEDDDEETQEILDAMEESRNKRFH